MSRLHLPQIEVLIVDDQVPTRELLSEFCLVQGSEVVTANDGRAAIAARTGDGQQFALTATSGCRRVRGADGRPSLESLRLSLVITHRGSTDSALRDVREAA